MSSFGTNTVVHLNCAGMTTARSRRWTVFTIPSSGFSRAATRPGASDLIVKGDGPFELHLRSWRRALGGPRITRGRHTDAVG
jgi:hypothetical protein